MSSPKGYGLATMVEILASVLPSARYAEEQERVYRHVGHFFLAIDPKPFRMEGAFEDNLDTLLDSLRAPGPKDPECAVMTAGDPEYAALDDRSRSGIPISRGIVEDIRFLCKACGAPFLPDRKN